jgi:hypothetical protein
MRLGHPTLALINDETFRRLCRARDLLAAEYQSQVLLEAAAREACLSLSFPPPVPRYVWRDTA